MRLRLRLLGFRLGLGNLVVMPGLLALRLRKMLRPNSKGKVATRKGRTNGNAASNGKQLWHWLC